MSLNIMARKLTTSDFKIKCEPRTELVNFITQQIADMFNDKDVNVAEMSIISIVILQMMTKYGAENHVAVPAAITIDGADGATYSYRIAKTIIDNNALIQDVLDQDTD